MIWDQLTSVQISEIDRNTPLIIPIAATEQHGAHLPLATDRMIGEHFALQVHQAIPNQVLILPAIGIGCSKHHMDFPGTLTLSHSVFKEQVEQVVQSAIFHGFNNFILLNSHGGNQGIGQVIIEELGNKYVDCELFMTSWWRLSREQLLKLNQTGFGGVGHAGEFETSLMLLIAPELVHTDKIEQGANQPDHEWAQADLLNGPEVSHYLSMKQLTPNGIFGDPRAASKQKGVQITKIVVDQLVRVVQDLSNK